MTSKLFMTPVGGLGETGELNAMLYHTQQSAVLVDCGVAFADERFPGANLIIHDFKDLDEFAPLLKGLIFTHGHEDHVGAVGFFRQHFPEVPIYATPFTLGIIRNKFDELKLGFEKLHEIRADQKFSLGDLSFETLHINHSIPEALGLIVRAEEITALHLTDFKIDRESLDGRVMDLEKIEALGNSGLDVLLMDSTNVFGAGWTISESEVRDNLYKLISSIEGRIFTCLFSSNVFRIRSLLECAERTGRKVAFTGRSTKEYSRIARATGWLKQPEATIFDVEEMSRFADSEVLVIMTGSQAEPRSVLQRMSENAFKAVRFRPDDSLVMSSKMIPGNEGRILEMLDRVAQMGVKIYSQDMELKIHASGHAKQDELREIFRLAKPRYFVPIHGEYRHLKRHVELAVESGVNESHCHIVVDGHTVGIGPDGWKNIGVKDFHRIFLNENNDEITWDAIRQRRRFSFNGLVMVSVVADMEEERVLPGIQLRASSMMGGDKQVRADEKLREILSRVLPRQKIEDEGKFRELVKGEVRQFYRDQFSLKPEVQVLVNWV